MINATLEHVEELAAGLSPQEQMKLVARISERLCNQMPAEHATAEREREEQLRVAERLLAECEDIEDDSQGLDTAELIRQMRDERIEQICRTNA